MRVSRGVWRDLIGSKETEWAAPIWVDMMGRLTLAIASDDPSALTTLRDKFAGDDRFELVAAETHERCLKQLDRHQPRVVIVVMSGKTASADVQRLVARSCGPGTVVLTFNLHKFPDEKRVQKLGQVGGVDLRDVTRILSRIANLLCQESQPVDQLDVEQLKSLTSREREILSLIAAGHSVKKISERIHRSGGTVARHRTNVMRKLHLNNRVALTHFAIRVGLVEA